MDHDPYQAAVQAMQENRLDEAHRFLLRALRREPENIQIWFLLGRTAPTFEAASFYYSRLVEQYPDNPFTQDALGALNRGVNKGTNTSMMSPVEIKQAIIKTIDLLTNPDTEKEAITRINNAVEQKDIIQRQQAVNVPEAPTTRKRVIIPQKLQIPLAYLAALTLAEGLTSLAVPQIGLILHGALLVGLFLHASLFARHGEQKFLMTLTLAPLIRLMSLSLPLVNFPFIYWYAIIGLPLLLAAFVVLRVTGYKADGIGLNFRALPWQLIIGLSGLVLGYVEYIILRPVPLIENLTWQKILVPALILLIFTGFLEELIFRGLIQRGAIGTLGNYGLLYVSALFAVLHLGYRSLWDVIFVFVVALFFGAVTIRTRSILGVTLSHGLTNITLYLIVPFLMNGSINPAASVPLSITETTQPTIMWSLRGNDPAEIASWTNSFEFSYTNDHWQIFTPETKGKSIQEFHERGRSAIGSIKGPEHIEVRKNITVKDVRIEFNALQTAWIQKDMRNDINLSRSCVA